MDEYSYENDPTAVVGRRVAAFLIDLLSAVVVGAVVLALTGLTKVITDDAGFAIDGPEGNIDDFDPSQLILEVGNSVYVVDSMRNFFIGAALFLLFLWIFVQALTGRTLGKWVTGVRTIAADGGNPGIPKSIGRTVLWVIDVFLIGPLLALSTAGHRRLGDLVGRTFVVDQEFAGTGITIEDGSARTRTVGDDEIDLREKKEPTPSRKDKKQAERDAEERLRLKAEADAKAKAKTETKIDKPAATRPSVEKATPVTKTPEPVLAETAATERTAVPAAAAYGAGAAAAASSSGPAWPEIAKTTPEPVTPAAATQVADASAATPIVTGAPSVASPTPISTPAVTAPSPVTTPPGAGTPPSSTAFPPTAFGGGSTGSATTPADATPTTPQPVTPEPVVSEPAPTPAAEQQPAQDAGGDWEYEPQWDDARQTYILWDARRSEWLQWNDGAGTWGPISQ